MKKITSSGLALPTKAENPEAARLRSLLASRSEFVIGIDEVGMGALAGPVAVGAVVTRVSWVHELVKDSKKFSDGKKSTAHEKRIKVLEEIIKPQVEFFFHVKMTSHDLDKYGIREAWMRCLWQVSTKCLKFFPDAIVVVDGDFTGAVPTTKALAIPKGDSLVAAVSAASILAKVERDKTMHLAHEIYPAYCFNSNMGYGTSDHMVALEEHGPSPIHRRSYEPIKSMEAKWQTTKRPGNAMRGSMR